MRSKVQFQQAIGRGTRLHCPHGCRRYCDHQEAKRDLVVLDFFSAYPELGVMTPADLCSDEPEQVEAIKKAIRDKQGKLTLSEISKIVAGEREQALIRSLKQARKHGRKTVYDARAVAAFYSDHDLFDYDPTGQGEWAEKPPAPEQLNHLINSGVDPKSIKNRGHAAMVIRTISRAKRERKPSVLQIGRLHSRGIDHSQMTLDLATKTISQHQHGKYKRARTA
jgi:hypothetical protein